MKLDKDDKYVCVHSLHRSFAPIDKGAAIQYFKQDSSLSEDFELLEIREGRDSAMIEYVIRTRPVKAG